MEATAAATALADTIEKSLDDLAGHPRKGRVPDDANLMLMGLERDLKSTVLQMAMSTVKAVMRRQDYLVPSQL